MLRNKEYTRNLPQFWNFVKDDVQLKNKKRHNLWPRRDFDLEFFKKITVFGGVSVEKIKLRTFSGV